ncbi:unnamed protein product [Cylindrotheca closterium]|uniref:Uncharacterized protein n=1 Tax=Cylindrotheca closterium TaxID=2856 RepID=A0AAD2CBA1_9STRA|nr:unnamed protein product [Cylindrotheca closterium]
MIFSALLILVAAAATIAPSQGCPYVRRSLQNGNGNGHGGGGGGGGQASEAYVQELLDSHFKVNREVIYHSDGSITTKTFSDDAQVAGWLQVHVAEMKARVDANMYVRSWDPFFVSMVDHHEETSVELNNLSNGIQVELSASTDCGQSLIEAHTKVVSLFVETGREESSKAHEVPDACQVASGSSPTPAPTSSPVSGVLPTLAPSTAPVSGASPTLAPTTPPVSGVLPTLAPSTAPVSGASPTLAPTTPPVSGVSPTLAPTTPPVSGVSPTLAPTTPPVSGVSPTLAPTTPSMAEASPTTPPGAEASPTFAPTTRPVSSEVSPTLAPSSLPGGKGDLADSSSPASSHGLFSILILSALISLMMML